MHIDIEFILPDRNFPDYSVFSRNINPLYFQFALPFLSEYVSKENILFVCKDHFEELVSIDEVLREEYVEWYAPDNEYYITTRRDNGQDLDIYILAQKKEVLMFFIRKSL